MIKNLTTTVIKDRYGMLFVLI